MSATAPSRPRGAAEPSTPRPTSTLWTLFLGLALVRLVTAKRKEPFQEVVFGPRKKGEAWAKAGEQSYKPRSEALRRGRTEADRGRAAETPSEIPGKGWKDIAWRVYAEIQEDRVLMVAAGVTFYGLLALFPAIGALVSLYGLFADPATIQEHLTLLSGFLPGGALEVIGDQISRIAGQDGGALGFAFFFGLALSLWSANAGMKAIFDALNIVYEEEEKRSFVRLTLESLLFTLGAIAFLLVALGAVIVLPILLNFLGLGGMGDLLLRIARWPLLALVLLFALACLYRYGPSRDKAEWRWVTWGSVIAGAVWLLFSMLYSWYVGNFGNYNETYGSLGAVIGFMMWIWLSTTIILVGAEINAEMEHQTAQDTTAGEEQPLGARGAQMADNVGKGQA